MLLKQSHSEMPFTRLQVLNLWYRNLHLAYWIKWPCIWINAYVDLYLILSMVAIWIWSWFSGVDGKVQAGYGLVYWYQSHLVDFRDPVKSAVLVLLVIIAIASSYCFACMIQRKSLMLAGFNYQNPQNLVAVAWMSKIILPLVAYFHELS